MYNEDEFAFKRNHPILYWSLIIVVIYCISFFITAGLLWVVCWLFNWNWWSWKISLGVWIILCILKGIFSPKNN